MPFRTVYRMGFVAFLAIVPVAAYTIERSQVSEWGGNAQIAGLVLVPATMAGLEVARKLAGEGE